MGTPKRELVARRLALMILKMLQSMGWRQISLAGGTAELIGGAGRAVQ